MYSTGRHFIGLGSSFILFGTQFRPISLDGKSNDLLTARSSDGMEITISLSFQYNIKTTLDSILKLYFEFGTDYEAAYVKVARSVFRDSVSDYTAFELVNSRSLVEQSMRADITAALDKYEAIVENFQLLDIYFPDAFSSSLSETQNEILRINVYQNQYDKILIDLQNSLTKAQTQAPTYVNQARARAASILASAQSNATSTKIRVNTLNSTLGFLQYNLTLTPTEMITYQYLSSLDQINSQQSLKINVGTPKSISCLTKSSTC